MASSRRGREVWQCVDPAGPSDVYALGLTNVSILADGSLILSSLVPDDSQQLPHAQLGEGGVVDVAVVLEYCPTTWRNLHFCEA